MLFPSPFLRSPFLPLFGLALFLLGAAPKEEEKIYERKTKPEDFAIEVERFRLGNGMIVLLSPDETASSVVVDLTFRAGARYEPEGLSGLAHFIEHLLMRGFDKNTNYIEILERRRAREVSAFTTPLNMTFRAVMPPEELPIALWAHAERLHTLPQTLRQEDFARHFSVVRVERMLRYLDVSYGLVDMAIQKKMFPVPHPLHGQVIGVPKELAQAKLADVQQFVRDYIVPDNAVLTLVGNFSTNTARAWIKKTVAALPARPSKDAPEIPEAEIPKPKTLRYKERLSRQPRVTVLWKFKNLMPRDRDALSFGANLLSNYVDGAFGTHVRAYLSDYAGVSYFRLDLVLPHDKPIGSAQNEAEALLRYLTAVEVSKHLFDATRIANDRGALFSLDSLIGRANLATALELGGEAPDSAVKHLSRHWKFTRENVRHVAWKHLIVGPPRIVVHSRPIRPRKAKLSWDERQEQ